MREQLAGEYEFLTGSDCEVILALYRKKGINFLEELNGIFAFALYDSEKDLYLVARDHMGIIPLYMGWDERNHFYVASELKALEGICKVIDPFLPGHYLCSTDKKMTRWYTRDWMQYDAVKNNGADIEQLREGLEEAVRRQLMSDVPYGVLLSGRFVGHFGHSEEIRRQAYRNGRTQRCVVAAATLVRRRAQRCTRPGRSS